MLYFSTIEKCNLKLDFMQNKTLEQVYNSLKKSREDNIGYLNTKGLMFNGKVVEAEKGNFIIFGLCDYLKIMPDDRIKKAAIEAIQNHGINFAVSRAYMKLALYRMAEDALSEVFNRPVILFARAALMHIGALNALIKEGDAIIFDQQVHATLQNGIAILKSQGVKIDIVRHNRMALLRDKILEIKDKYHRIWYLADGIYSMYGDPIDSKGMLSLLDEFDQLRLYVDDAHGLSWTGKNGTGYVLEHFGYHPQVILTSSLGKGFGAGGGIVVCPDMETKERILYSGSPLMFSSPIEPSMQGAIIASSRIHLSDEIYEKQKNFKKLLDYFYKGVEERQLPIVNKDKTPIGYFPTGQNDAIFFMVDYLQKNGFLITAGIHPAVGLNNTGVRIQISLYSSENDIDRLLDTIKEGYEILEREHGVSIERILKFFKK